MKEVRDSPHRFRQAGGQEEDAMGSMKRYVRVSLVVFGALWAMHATAEPRLFSKVSSIPVPAGEEGISSHGQ